MECTTLPEDVASPYTGLLNGWLLRPIAAALNMPGLPGVGGGVSGMQVVLWREVSAD